MSGLFLEGSKEMNPDRVGSFKTGFSIATLNQFWGIVFFVVLTAVLLSMFVFSTLLFITKWWGKVSNHFFTSRLTIKMREEMEWILKSKHFYQYLRFVWSGNHNLLNSLLTSILQKLGTHQCFLSKFSYKWQFIYLYP